MKNETEQERFYRMQNLQQQAQLQSDAEFYRQTVTFFRWACYVIGGLVLIAFLAIFIAQLTG
jgi:hypothetical protein